eukprot:150793-Amphidinium_carterae.1
MQDSFCVDVRNYRAKDNGLAAGYHGDLQNTAQFLGFNCKAAILYQLISRRQENQCLPIPRD